jgi:hypothetical protein
MARPDSVSGSEKTNKKPPPGFPESGPFSNFYIPLKKY